jgi:hypothetical protein
MLSTCDNKTTDTKPYTSCAKWEAEELSKKRMAGFVTLSSPTSEPTVWLSQAQYSALVSSQAQLSCKFVIFLQIMVVFELTICLSFLTMELISFRVPAYLIMRYKNTC